jgi:putative copper export protein
MQSPALLSFCYYLEHTQLNGVVQEYFWIVPVLQIIHILAVAAILIGSLQINLRILGYLSESGSITTVIARYKYLIWIALPVLLISGSIMIVGEPARSLTNWTFQLKMALLVGVVLIAFIFQRNWQSTNSYEKANASSRILAIISTIFLIGIVAAGRWIAYT